ncbi:MAG: oligopeptidase A [Acidimicrobiia bacterium]|nr:MAG: oligopeptidase A [Acidimicrobiia bacterium]
MLFDYTTVTPDSIAVDVEETITRAEALVAQVVDPDNPLTVESVLRPLDDVADLMARAFGRTGFMGYVHPDPDTRAAGKEAEAKLETWQVELTFREDLYRAVKAFAETPRAAELDGEWRRFLDFLLRDFRKAGHELPAASRERLRELANRLVQLGVEFERNIAEHRDHLEVTIDDLDGLPEGYVDTLEPGDRPGTFRVTMAYPHVVPFLENARRRDLREALSRKFNSRAVAENRPILEEAVAIRREIAEIFGQPSWAHHQLDERMAKTPEAVEDFYRRLRPPLTEAARREIAKMAALLEADTGDSELQVYDWRYYDTQIRKSEFGVDPAQVAAYFPLEAVIDGMLEITGEVFGLDYQQVDAPVWHPDVTTYRVYDRDTGEEIAHFHMDLFPREGKFSHAAAFPLVPGRRLADGSYQRPMAAIVANFTKPTAKRPSLLQHSEVETLFHEFGHILHQVLTRAELVRFSGTNTERDFVEAPSQIMEHWVWKADVLRRFARHHQTGEPIPEELVDQLVAARRLNIAVATLRQMVFGTLDLRLHDATPDKDLDRILVEATEVGLLPLQEGTFFPASFGHLLGGYDAGYYGYLWSEVYGDDMFSRFEEEGYLDPRVGREYREKILERGGTRDGIELLRDFLGREPNHRAFLANLGIGTD